MNETTIEIDLTPSAAARVASIAKKTGKPAILRLAIDGGGCSGFQYKFELAEAAAEDDIVATRDGVSQPCPSDACPVKAHGELTLMKFYLTKHDPPVAYRDLQLTNADFLIVGAPE